MALFRKKVKVTIQGKMVGTARPARNNRNCMGTAGPAEGSTQSLQTAE